MNLLAEFSAETEINMFSQRSTPLCIDWIRYQILTEKMVLHCYFGQTWPKKLSNCPAYYLVRFEQ